MNLVANVGDSLETDLEDSMETGLEDSIDLATANSPVLETFVSRADAMSIPNKAELVEAREKRSKRPTLGLLVTEKAALLSDRPEEINFAANLRGKK